MNDIQIFNNPAFGQIRVTEQSGKVWLIAKDVCDILGLNNSRQAIASLEEDEKADVIISDTSSNGVTQRRAVNAVDESGLYALIFKSRKPEAKAFRKWVTDEVLPSIRKHGLYAIDEVLNDPTMLIKALQDLQAERAQAAALRTEVKVIAAERDEAKDDEVRAVNHFNWLNKTYHQPSLDRWKQREIRIPYKD
jgi:prophage antirepressor-like protein